VTPVICEGAEHRHVGKFADCVAEALWSLSLDSLQDDQTGNSGDWLFWVALFLDVNETTGAETDNGFVIIPTGSYLLYEVPSGFVHAVRFAFASEAQKAFDGHRDAFWGDGPEE